MNPYYNAMDRCTPPEGMGERLAQNVLSALPGRAGAFKPRGFRKKTAAVFAKLRDMGYTDADLQRITTPIGLSIKAETPAEIAVSIAAQLIQLRAETK